MDNMGKLVPETNKSQARDDGVAVASAGPYVKEEIERE